MTMGGDQELILGLRTRTGGVWGELGLSAARLPARSAPRRRRSSRRWLRASAKVLGARRALLVGEATGSKLPGLVILTGRLEMQSTTPGVERWLAELPDGNWDAGRLPSAVFSVAARAMRSVGAPGETALARVLSRGWHVGGAARRAAGVGGGAAGGRHRRTGASRTPLPAAHGGLRP